MIARNVFLGLALDKLGKTEESEKAYVAAIRAKDNDKTAWQGLINLYEKQGGQKVDSYRDAAVKLALLFGEEYDYEIMCGEHLLKQSSADVGLGTTNTGAGKFWTST